MDENIIKLEEKIIEAINHIVLIHKPTTFKGCQKYVNNKIKKLVTIF